MVLHVYVFHSNVPINPPGLTLGHYMCRGIDLKGYYHSWAFDCVGILVVYGQ